MIELEEATFQELSKVLMEPNCKELAVHTLVDSFSDVSLVDIEKAVNDAFDKWSAAYNG